MLRISPLGMGFIYLTIGGMFVSFATANVSKEGWTFFSYLIVMVATTNVVSSFRFFALHVMIKKRQNHSE